VRRTGLCTPPGLREEARQARIDTRSHPGDRIRPPGTRHRHTLPVVLLGPRTADDALDALSGAAWDPEVAVQPRLTRRTWNRLRYGDEEKNGSALVWSICCGAAAVDYPEDKLYRQLLDPQNVGGRHCSVVSQRHPGRGAVVPPPCLAERREVGGVQTTFENRDDAIQAVMAMAEEIGNYTWEGIDLPATMYEKANRIGGGSMRRLITFIVVVCIEWGTITPYVSRFYVDDEIGMTPKTVAKAFRGLELLGWLRLLERGKGTRASTYQLLVNNERSNSPAGSTSHRNKLGELL